MESDSKKRPRINKASRMYVDDVTDWTSETGRIVPKSAPRWVGIYPAVVGCAAKRKDVLSLLDTTAFPCSLLTIWIFGSSYWSPN